MSSSARSGESRGLGGRFVVSGLVVAVSFLAGFVTRPSREGADSALAVRDENPPAEGPRDTVVGRSATQAPRRFAIEPAVTRDLVEVSSVELNRMGLSIEQIFDSEPRDGSWAPAAEQLVHDQFGEFLQVFLPDAEGFQVECRRSICKASFVVTSDQTDLAVGLEQMMPLGEILQPWAEPLEDGSGKTRVGLRFLNGEQWLPLANYRARVREAMAKRFPNGLAAARKWLEQHGGLKAAVGLGVER